MDEDTYDAACAQQQQEEAEQWERHRALLAQSRQESAEFERQFSDWHKHILKLNSHRN